MDEQLVQIITRSEYPVTSVLWKILYIWLFNHFIKILLANFWNKMFHCSSGPRELSRDLFSTRVNEILQFSVFLEHISKEFSMFFLEILTARSCPVLVVNTNVWWDARLRGFNVFLSLTTSICFGFWPSNGTM